MMTAKIRMMLVCMIVLSVGRLASAAPVIKDFSSKGGSPQNKENPKDRMYLVKAGDKITFTVKAEGAEKYVWRVNKKLQKANAPSFTWTVPAEKGIWEIHVQAGDKDGQAHQEWVVSTLGKDEAPDLFEYYSDGKYTGRRETDPWGRPLKEWTVEQREYDRPSVGRCWMEPAEGGQKAHALRAPSKTAYGTWRFRFRFPMGYFIPPNGGSGPRTQIYYTFIRDGKGSKGHAYRYNKVSDTHNYFFVRCVPRFGYRMQLGHEDSGFKQGRGWYEVTIVRTRDGRIYSYITDIEKNKTYLQFLSYSKAGDTCSYVRMSLNRPLWDMFPRVTVYVDGLEIYKDKYLFPNKSAAYGRYVENWKWMKKPIDDPANAYLLNEWNDFRMRQFSQTEINTINKRHHGHRVSAKRIREWTGRELRWMRGKRHYRPVYGRGIVIQGSGVTLEDVARMVNDPSKLRYDSVKKAWICYTDLVVGEGAELVVKDTTLRMHCAAPGRNKIVVLYGSTVRIENSTITSNTSNYFLWRFVGAANYGYNLGMETGGINALSYGSFGSFLVENSTIDNCAYMFIDAPRRVRFRNVKITNLHQADAGEYSASRGEVQKRKEFIKGPKSFCIFIKNYCVFDFDMDRVKFSSAGKPVDIIFRLNSDKNRLNVYNCDFGNENVVVKPSVKMMSFWNSRWPEYYNSVLGMVNCRFKSISVPEARAFAVPKYYLDVKVVRAGKAVRGAKVTVSCEDAGGKYPPENMVTRYDHFNKDSRLYVVAIKMGQPVSTTTTTATGHTPGPSDKAATLILPDFVQDKSGRKEFKYTITVEAGGKKKIITGVDPGPYWHRPDPNKPTYTITAVLDGKTVTEAELKKSRLAGPP